MGDREDELRRSIANDRVASRVLAAMTAEKMARVRLFEEGIKEQLRLREWLLDDTARCLEEIDRVKAETERIKAETERIKADLGVAEPAVNGRGGGGARGRKRTSGSGGRRGKGRGRGPAAAAT